MPVLYLWKYYQFFLDIMQLCWYQTVLWHQYGQCGIKNKEMISLSHFLIFFSKNLLIRQYFFKRIDEILRNLAALAVLTNGIPCGCPQGAILRPVVSPLSGRLRTGSNCGPVRRAGLADSPSGHVTEHTALCRQPDDSTKRRRQVAA